MQASNKRAVTVKVRSLIYMFSTLLVQLVSYGSGSAAVTVAQEREAEALLQKGRPSEAARLLRERIDTRDGPQAWFLLGKAYEKSGNLASAAQAYQQVLHQDPAAHRVKLDLARVLQTLGDNANAERLYNEVRATRPPANVVANIDHYLAMMNDRNSVGSAWRTRATIGGGYDSNPGNATSASQVTMFGLPFTLSKEARKRGDSFYFIKSEIDHVYRWSREFAWVSNLTLAIKKYANLGDFDSFNASISTGPVWQPNERLTAMAPVYLNVNRFETSSKAFDDRWQSWEVGVSPQFRYSATDRVSLNLDTALGRRSYFSDADKDATIFNLTPGVDLKTPGLGTFSVGSSYGRELADTSPNSNTSLGVNIGWQYTIDKDLVTSIYGSYTDIRYDDAEAIYGNERREDERTVLGVDIAYTWDAIQADILLSYARTWNQSNLPIYTYDKDTVSLSVRKVF